MQTCNVLHVCFERASSQMGKLAHLTKRVGYYRRSQMQMACFFIAPPQDTKKMSNICTKASLAYVLMIQVYNYFMCEAGFTIQCRAKRKQKAVAASKRARMAVAMQRGSPWLGNRLSP